MITLRSLEPARQPESTLRWTDELVPGEVPSSFLDIHRYLFKPNGIVIEMPPRPEVESHDYGALRFSIEGVDAVFRQAKTTPKKSGQFVTLWKRATPQSAIAPFDHEDAIEWFVIATRNAHRHGVFLFDRDVLARKGVVSSPGKEGKRALRVYAPWDRPHSKQAIRTQAWQLNYFHPLDSEPA